MKAEHVVTPLQSRPGARPWVPSSSASKMKETRGIPRLFDEDGRLTEGLTEMILVRLNGRKYLEVNKVNLLIGLLKIYSSACAQSSPEQTYSEEIEDLQIKCMNLHARKS